MDELKGRDPLEGMHKLGNWSLVLYMGQSSHVYLGCVERPVATEKARVLRAKYPTLKMRLLNIRSRKETEIK